MTVATHMNLGQERFDAFRGVLAVTGGAAERRRQRVGQIPHDQTHLPLNLEWQVSQLRRPGMETVGALARHVGETLHDEPAAIVLAIRTNDGKCAIAIWHTQLHQVMASSSCWPDAMVRQVQKV